MSVSYSKLVADEVIKAADVGNLLEGGTGVHLQPVGDLGCVVRVGWDQHWLVPLRRTRLIGDWGR